MIMRHLRVLIPIAMAGLLVAAATTSAHAKKTGAKLLLQDLKAKGVSAHEASAVSTAACHALAKHQQYDVLCGDDLRNMMQFGALSATFNGCDDETCYAGMARALKARYVVSGTVTKLGKLFMLSLSMFDTKTNKPAGRTTIKAETLEQLHRDTAEGVSALLTSTKD